MKCIKNNNGEVKRLSNEIAERQVASGLAKYCPKSEWKTLRVKPVEVIVPTDEQKQEIMRKADKRKMEKVKKTPIKKYMEN
jgi:hypothetical protein